MSFLLKATYVHVFTSLVAFAVYGFWIFGFLGIEYFTGPDALVRIGKAIGTLIIVGYAFEIFVMVAVVGKQSYLSAQRGFDPIDERDRQISHKSIYYSHMVLCGGIFLSVGVLAIGFEAFWALNAIVLAFFFSDIAELGTKLFYYHGAS